MIQKVGSISGSHAYAASKRAVSTWADGLRAELFREKILINRIEPGFVSTPMVSASTNNAMFPVDVKVAATIIRNGLANDLPVVTFPSSMFLIASTFHGLADGIRDAIASSGFLRIIGYKPAGGRKAKGGSSAASDDATDKKSD